MCNICGNTLSGKQKETCGRACRIKLDTIKRREAGRLRKANMDPEAYAQKVERGKRFADKAKKEKRYLTRFDCVTCGGELWHNTKHDNGTLGYNCSTKCSVIHNTITASTEAVQRRMLPRFHIPTHFEGIKFYGCNCQTCGTSFVLANTPGKYCSAKCNPDKDWQISPRLRLAIYQRDNWTCHLCGDTVEKHNGFYQPKGATLDHVVPRSKGGNNHPINLKTACHECNSIRGNKDLKDFEVKQTSPRSQLLKRVEIR